MPLVHAVNVHKAFHGTEVLKGIDLDVAAGEVVCLLGPVRLGQDDLPALHQPARDHRRRPDLGRRRPDGLRRARRQAAPADRQADRRAAPRDRHGLPAVQPVPAQDRAAEHHGGAGPGQGREEGRRPASAALELLERVGLADKPRRLPGAALRRAAAAGGDRPGAGDGPQADAVRRADLGARPRAGRRGARGDARAGRRAA